jgi:hypothetical protein
MMAVMAVRLVVVPESLDDSESEGSSLGGKARNSFEREVVNAKPGVPLEC